MASSLRWCVIALVALVGTGCLRGTPPRQAATPTAVAIGFVHQSQSTGWSTNVPEAFVERQRSELTARNLTARGVVLSPQSAQAALTRARLASLAAADTTGAPIVILVESASRYDSQIVGRYRWTVFAKITVADAKDLDRATSTSVDVPITLEYDHQRDDAALLEAASPIAKEVGVAIDSYLASYGSARTAHEPRPATGVDGPPAYDAIYFVMLDRFANGDTGNDAQPGRQLAASDPAAWHGGDLRGLIDRLDHIEALGIKTVWISPHFATRQETFGGHGAFHGYWVADLAAVDPGFGSRADLLELENKLGARGMRLIYDLVLNHVGPETPMVRARPGWFHPAAPIVDWNDPVEAQTHQVHGLPDFDQSRPEVYAFLLETSLAWIETGAAGFRLDAVRHISPVFWRRYLSELRERAGKPVTLLGEVFDGNPAAIRGAFELGFDRLFDFPLHYAAVDAFCRGGSLLALAAALGVDRAYDNPAGLVTFADNHDLPRIASVCTDERDLERMFSFLTSIRGVPSITYGTEVGLRGKTEPANRGDMRFGALSATGAHLQRRLAARRAHPALRGGARRVLVATDDALVWAQQAGGETVVIGISRSGAPTRVRAFETSAATLEAGFSACGPGCLELAAGATGFAWIESAPPVRVEHRTVRISASGVPAGDALVIGNVPEVGVWDQAAALRGAHAGPERRFELSLPVGEALAFKLAVASGETTTYEAGGNRALLVTDEGEGPLAVELSWRK